MKIRQVTIYSADLPSQMHFYGDVLGFPVNNCSNTQVSFAIGYSTLTIKARPVATPYHLAINIPPFQDHSALTWLKERVEVLKDEGEELIRFDSWNATAMYFYDEDRNIIEFIARRDLPVKGSETFRPSQVIGISEVGLPVADIRQAYQEINQIARLELYDGNFDRFCAAGDVNGLFIIINKFKKKWYPTQDPAFSSDLIVEGDISLRFEKGVVSPLYH